jgi:hypothetical protein
MKELEFSHNWNGKLENNAFTTFRLSSRFDIGEWVNVRLDIKSLGPHLIIGKKHLKAGDLNEWIAWLDTGYSLAETRNILNNMYKKRGGVQDHDMGVLYLLRKPNKKEAESFKKAEAEKQTTIF